MKQFGVTTHQNAQFPFPDGKTSTSLPLLLPSWPLTVSPFVSFLQKLNGQPLKFLAPTLWNSLPGNIKEEKLVASFKTVLKTHGPFPSL
jgi:hypothetical protein